MTTERDRRIQTRPNDNTEGRDGTLLAGTGSDGQARALEVEERTDANHGYDGLILASMEQVLELMRSRFAMIAGGRADADGSIPAADQAADGAAQRILVDEHGRIWVRQINIPGVFANVSERYAIVGEDARAMPLDRFAVAAPTAKELLLARNLEISSNTQDEPYALVATTPVWVEVGDQVSVTILYTPQGEVPLGRPLFYPQFSQNQHVFGLPMFEFITGISSTISAGPLDGAQLDGQGRLLFDPFDADLSVARSETILDGFEAKASGFLRFALLDTSTVGGLVTMIVRVS